MSLFTKSSLVTGVKEKEKKLGWAFRNTVRSGAEEYTFWGARLDVLIFRLHSYHVLISYSAECSGPKFHKTLMFFGQAGAFLSFQARRSSAMRSSTSDLTVNILWLFFFLFVVWSLWLFLFLIMSSWRLSYWWMICSMFLVLQNYKFS